MRVRVHRPAYCTLDFKDKRNKTALMKAAEAGHVPCVRYLIQQGADTELEEGDPHHYAEDVLSVFAKFLPKSRGQFPLC